MLHVARIDQPQREPRSRDGDGLKRAQVPKAAGSGKYPPSKGHSATDLPLIRSVDMALPRHHRIFRRALWPVESRSCGRNLRDFTAKLRAAAQCSSASAPWHLISYLLLGQLTMSAS